MVFALIVVVAAVLAYVLLMSPGTSLPPGPYPFGLNKSSTHEQVLSKWNQSVRVSVDVIYSDCGLEGAVFYLRNSGQQPMSVGESGADVRITKRIISGVASSNMHLVFDPASGTRLAVGDGVKITDELCKASDGARVTCEYTITTGSNTPWPLRVTC